MPQATTGTTPYFMMFNRETRSKLPELRHGTAVTSEEVRDRDLSSKLCGKIYSDRNRGAADKSLEVFDKVLLKVGKTNKLSPNFHPSPFKVVDRKREQVTVRNDSGMELRKNTSFMKKYNKQVESTPVELSFYDGGDRVDRDVEVNGEFEERTNAEQTTAATTAPLKSPNVWTRPSR